MQTSGNFIIKQLVVYLSKPDKMITNSYLVTGLFTYLIDNEINYYLSIQR